MRRPRGLTLPEILISSTLLLLMIGLGCMASVSYLKSYQHYTDRGLQIRLAAKQLETLTYELRSVRTVYQTDRAALRQGIGLEQGFSCADSEGQAFRLQLVGGDLQRTQGQTNTTLMRGVSGLRFQAKPGEHGDSLTLELQLKSFNQPFVTAVSWRNVAYQAQEHS